MTDDIRKHETRIVGPLTKRQLIWLVIGSAIAVPIALAVPTSWDNKIFILLAVLAPAILCGFLKVDGTNFDLYFGRVVYKLILTPRRRVYKTKNTYRELLKQAKKKEEQAMLSKMTPMQQKKYQAQKNSKTLIQSKEYKIYK